MTSVRPLADSKADLSSFDDDFSAGVDMVVDEVQGEDWMQAVVARG